MPQLEKPLITQQKKCPRRSIESTWLICIYEVEDAIKGEINEEEIQEVKDQFNKELDSEKININPQN